MQLNIAKLNAQAPHWIIHEIGTGNSANVRYPNVPLAKGRPRNDAPSRKIVSSQKGRPIWVLHDLTGDPTVRHAKSKRALKRRVGKRKADIPFGNAVIGREIKAQHYIKQGAEAGFQMYRTSVLTAARRSFKK